MTDLKSRLLQRLTGAEFDEIPVDLDTFCTSPDFLGSKSPLILSEYQKQLANAMTQIYRKDTLVALWGEEVAEIRFAQTCKEVVMQLGKGSGKDFTSTVAVAYVVYLLMCLKDPAVYFDKAPGDSIDIINIAINADQAQRVFFENFMNKIKNCPWFDGKFEDKAGAVKFDKNINVYSGHSEREAFEGYNTFMVILDEISGFAEAPDDESDDMEELKKTSKAIYKMYRGSVTSRFADFGKLVLLSFPRHKDDFIQKAYNKLIAEKETIIRCEKLKRDPDLPDGIEDNEFWVEWEEDHIIRYARPKVFALRRPSWEVNPSKKIQDYADDFWDDMGDALGRFACMPSNVTRGFFKNMEKAEETFSRINGVDQDGIFHPRFLPRDEETQYFVHVDLAQKHDKCAVALAHVDKWIEYKLPQSEMVEYLPLVVVDAIRWWTPNKKVTVDFKAVVEYIKALRRRGFNIKLATFDRWNSHDTMMDLERNGIETELLSVAKKHYDDWLVTMYDSRLVGPHEETLLDEMRELIEKKGKIDHPRKGNKDLCDAVAGAIFNAVAYTPKIEVGVVDALTLDDWDAVDGDFTDGMPKAEIPVKNPNWDRDNVIVVPKSNIRDAPPEIQALYDEIMSII